MTTKHKKQKVLSLFDFSGNMVIPWRDAGYECWIVDIAHPDGTSFADGIHRIGMDLAGGAFLNGEDDIKIIFAFPPCTHLAVSGARWFREKGLRALASAINLFATAVEVCEMSSAPYMIENPVSTISTYWRKPDYSFHPYEFTGYCPEDNYTKKTCIWGGNGFKMPHSWKDENLPPPDDRIHKMGPSEQRARIRSNTPMGFARAVFEVNK